ncbi:S8 family peptidase [Paenibacillus soyae]|uniref:S8 family serine peptidase n=1 Tax=Paenibacillus soyae TaxID=2969249 RepID=A0A9X2MT46_9BACL|nr:S8 family serine peptidase [Paenibacillus soyae]MCR2805802.1 S8 family serine peptidase [Paenibacillus soyae]
MTLSSIYIKSILSVVLLSLALPTQWASAGASPGATQHEVIVVYKNEEGKAAILEDSSDVSHEFDIIPAVAASATGQELAELANDPNIAYIEPNRLFRAVETGLHPAAEQAEQSQWGFQAIQPAPMWSAGFTGAGVKIAVIDTGIHPHRELTIAGGVSTVDYTGDFADDNGHGTHVAGIIAARRNGEAMVGIAPDAELYAVKSMDASGNGTLQDLLEALEWSIEHGMDIINLSLGSPEDSPLIREMVDRAYAEGIVVIAASGNNQVDVPLSTYTVYYPAKYDSVIAVGAISRWNSRGDFSSVGAEVEAAAPGVDIISTYVNENGTDGYAQASGTSQAAPHVTGMVALLMQKYPSMTNAQLRRELRKFAIDLGTPGRDIEFGYGALTFAAPSGSSSAYEPQSLSEAVLEGSEGGRFQERLEAWKSEWSLRELPARTLLRGNAPLGVSLQLAAGSSNFAYIDESSVRYGENVFVLNGSGERMNDFIVQVLFNRIVITPSVDALLHPNETYRLIIDSSVRGKTSLSASTAYELTSPLLIPFSVAQPTAYALTKQGAWYDETVQWGLENRIVTGYEDGSFKPNKPVSEAEFLAMLLRAFEPDLSLVQGERWADSYYARAKALRYPVKSYTSLTPRGTIIARRQVAELISSTDGVRFSGDDAIHYLLAFGLAEGKQAAPSIEGFNGAKGLTRAEALQFVRNVIRYGSGALLERPLRASDRGDLPEL